MNSSWSTTPIRVFCGYVSNIIPSELWNTKIYYGIQDGLWLNTLGEIQNLRNVLMFGGI